MNKTTITIPGVENYFVQEAFNVLRTNIQFSGPDVKVIALTSVEQNEGKTVLTLHLGRSLSELGKRVLVIDADLRKSVMVGRNSDSSNVCGLSETISGMTELQDAVYKTQYPNLHVLFSGKYPPNPVKLLNSSYFSELIEAVSEVYDYVIIDTPPIGLVIDAAVIAANCDSALLVIGSSHIPYKAAQEAVEQLKKAGCTPLGVILNNTGSKSKDKYYGRRGKKKYYRYYTPYGEPPKPEASKKSEPAAEQEEKADVKPEEPEEPKKDTKKDGKKHGKKAES